MSRPYDPCIYLLVSKVKLKSHWGMFSSNRIFRVCLTVILGSVSIISNI